MSPRQEQPDLREVLDAIRLNNQEATLERQEIRKKMDLLSMDLSNIRREQAQSIADLRRDFERLFVPRAEYDPKHQILQEKMREYDLIIDRSRNTQEEYTRYKARVDELKEDVAGVRADITGIKEHSSKVAGRILPWISLAIALASVVLLYAQHLSFH